MKLPFLTVICVAALGAQVLPQLPTSGCPMAHCDAHLNDAVREVTPSVGDIVASDPGSLGANEGLGCSSNATIVACSFASTGSNLVVYDAGGNRIFAAPPGTLNYNAAKSAPIVFTNGMVLLADNIHVILFNADGSVNWMTTKPDTNPPISPVLVGTGIVLVATAVNGAITTYDLSTGQLLATFHVTSASCPNYNTLNTPAVNGSRAYVVSACVGEQTNGGLAAIDVATSGATRGSMTLAWLYAFPGPSGASPLFTNGVVFFDGVISAGSSHGTFMAVSDTASGPVQVWQMEFSTHFAANAGQDPRGGIWVFPVGGPYLYRLGNNNGSILQRLPVPIPAGHVGPYVPSSAVSLSRAANGDVVLTYGAKSLQASEPATVVAADVTTSTVIWQTDVPGPAGNQTAAQFPIVVNSQGFRRVVFPGSIAGTYFVGAP